MLHYTASGPVQVSAQAAARAAQKAMTELLTVIDARYAALPSLPTIKAGQSLAELLAQASAPAATADSILKAADAIDTSASATAAECLALLQRADHHAAFLKSAADHIETGARLEHSEGQPPELLKAVTVMRHHRQAGDLDGTAQEVVDTLRSQSRAAAAALIPALDFHRKYQSTAGIAKTFQRSEVLKRMKAAMATGQTVESEETQAQVIVAEKAAQRGYRLLHNAYAKSYLSKTASRRPPKMLSASPFEVIKVGKSFGLRGN